MTTRGKTLGVIAALAATAALAWLAWPAAVAVEIASVTRAPMVTTVDASGRTRSRNRRVVAATASGHLARIAIQAGDRVEAGAPLATLGASVPMPLDPRTHAELEARLRSALATVAEAAAGVERARVARAHADREFARMRELQAGGAAARQQVDAAEFEARARATELRSAELARATAAEAVALVRSQLAHGYTDHRKRGAEEPPVIVRAPAAGRVLRVLTEVEGPVGVGTPLVEIAEEGAVEVVVEVLTADAMRVRLGARVRFDRWGGDEALSGRVRAVEPAAFTKISSLGVEEQRVNVLVDPAGDEARWASLGEAFRLEARIVTWEGTVTQAPLAAMAREGDRWTTFRVHGGRAERTGVVLGHRADGQVEVLEGLAPGDEVIAYPGTRVRDGVRVRPER